MATRTNNNTHYYINPAYLTFVENSGYGANLIQVSASSSCYIRVFIPGVIKYDADGNYRRWKVTAYNNKFPDDIPAQRGKWFIYVRMEKEGTSALIIYDQVERGVHGAPMVEKTDDKGNVTKVEGEYDEDKFLYYYIHIGEVGPTSDAKTDIREISYDTGRLESDQVKTEGTQLNEMWELDKFTTPWLIKAKQWLTDFTVKGFITLIGGLIFKKNDIEKRIVDVKRSVDSDLQYLKNPDGTDMKDEEGNPVPNPLYVPVNDETIPTTACAMQLIGGKFLRKDQDDRSTGKISSDKGFEVGQFTPGMIGGSGAQLYKDEHDKTILEVDRIYGREELLVPKITFNCIDVVTGEMAQTFAYGTIKRVWVDKDGNHCAELDLLDDEYGTLHVDDICRGIFHFLEGENATSYTEDENGFHNYSGFSTSYFTPQRILVNEKGRMEFVYGLQYENGTHPCPGMNFYAYGNFDQSETNRHSITYHTREYTRRLDNVTTWVINPDKNIMMQQGNLEGLEYGGEDLKGYSAFMKNIYLTGGVINLTPQQKEDLKGDSAYSVFLSDYIGTIHVNEKGEVVAGEYSDMNVTTGDENVTTEGKNVVISDVLLRTQIQAYRGKDELRYSDTVAEGCYKASIHASGCIAELSNGIVSVTKVLNIDNSYVRIYVNCEGYHPMELTFKIQVARDGKSSFSCVIFTRAESAPAIPKGGNYDQPMPFPNPAEDDTKWEDGVPQGDLQLWMSRRIYSTDGEYPQTEWSEPRPLTDTTDFEVIYSPMDEPNAIPDGFSKTEEALDPEWEAKANAAHWYDDPFQWNVEGNKHKGKGVIWMATNTAKNGIWQGWKKMMVKGEDGDSPLLLQASVKTVTRNSFGAFQPEKILVRAIREGVEEATNMALFLVDKNGEAICDKDNPDTSWQTKYNVSQWEFSPAEYKLQDFASMIFRCYAEQESYYSFDVNVDPPIYSEDIQFIGDGHSGPMPRNRGKYDEYTAYFYNEEYRDFVWTDDGKVYMRDALGVSYTENKTYDDIDGVPREGGVKGEIPGNSVYWKESRREALMAIDTALIEGANIAGFMFKGGRMVSQDMSVNDNPLPDANLVLDGTTGYFKCVDANIDGELTARKMTYRTAVGIDGEDVPLDGYTMAVGPGSFVLPSLTAGENIQIRAFNPSTLGGVNKPMTITSTYVGQPMRMYHKDLYDDGKDGFINLWEVTVNYDEMYTFTGVGGTFQIGGTLVSGYWMVSSSAGSASGAATKVITDGALDESSKNPVANSIITNEFAEVRKELAEKIQIANTYNEAVQGKSGVLYLIR